MRAKLEFTRTIKCNTNANDKKNKLTESAKRNAKKRKIKANFCINNCPHINKDCDGSCKEFRDWQKSQKNKKTEQNKTL